MLRRSRFIGALIALVTLAACGGPPVPGLPNPMSGISGLTDMISSQFGIPNSVANKTVGGLLGVANSNLPSSTWDALAGSFPGADALLTETLRGMPGGMALGTLDDLENMLGQDAGVSSSDLRDMGDLMGDFLGSAVSDETMKDQISDIF